MVWIQREADEEISRLATLRHPDNGNLHDYILSYFVFELLPGQVSAVIEY